MNFKNFFLVLFFSYKIFALIPQDFQNHLAQNRSEIKKISQFGFNDDQIGMIINGYIHSMAEIYQLSQESYSHEEVFKKIKNIIPPSVNAEKTQHFVYNGTKIPFSFVGQGNGDKEMLTLSGIFKSHEQPFSNNDNTCLQIVLDEENKNLHLDWIATADIVCPIPVTQKAGSYLLNLATAMAIKLEYKTITLDDVSDVMCPKTGYITSLAYLRVFKQGETWYNSWFFFFFW